MLYMNNYMIIVVVVVHPLFLQDCDLMRPNLGKIHKLDPSCAGCSGPSSASHRLEKNHQLAQKRIGLHFNFTIETRFHEFFHSMGS